MYKKKFHAIGMMSGTSLDGLDLAYCSYTSGSKKWGFKIIKASTINYDKDWKKKLSSAHLLTGLDLTKLHSDYGHWLGVQCQKFIKRNKIKVLDLIASHGHTIFHQPSQHFTLQIGDGNAIHAITKFPVVSDFRSLDIHLNGQGAPLVPIGDQLLFADFDVCLNLGGIANISLEKNRKRIAFDICFVNMGLNFLIGQSGKDFDNNGETAAKGKIDLRLLAQLNNVYKNYKPSRFSLAREQFENDFIPLLNNLDISLEDRLRTFCECIVDQLLQALPTKKSLKILITGGGAKNKFLIKLLQAKSHLKNEVSIPAEEIIDFKEALIFGLLGVLRVNNSINVLKSVTKSKRDSVSGSWIGS